MGATGLNPGHANRRFTLTREEKVSSSESTENLLDSSSNLNATYESMGGISLSLGNLTDPFINFPRERLEESFANIVPSMDDSVSKLECLLERIGTGFEAFVSQEDLASDAFMMLRQRWVSIAKVLIIAEYL